MSAGLRVGSSTGAELETGNSSRTDVPFSYGQEWCNYLYLNGVIDSYETVDDNGEPQNLWEEYSKIAAYHEHFAMQNIQSPADIYPVFRELFKKKLA